MRTEIGVCDNCGKKSRFMFRVADTKVTITKLWKFNFKGDFENEWFCPECAKRLLRKGDTHD
jgi:hypothetical protein